MEELNYYIEDCRSDIMILEKRRRPWDTKRVKMMYKNRIVESTDKISRRRIENSIKLGPHSLFFLKFHAHLQK